MPIGFGERLGDSIGDSVDMLWGTFVPCSTIKSGFLDDVLLVHLISPYSHFHFEAPDTKEAPHAVASPCRATSAPSHFHMAEPLTIGLVPWIGQANMSPLRATSFPSHFHLDAD